MLNFKTSQRLVCGILTVGLVIQPVAVYAKSTTKKPVVAMSAPREIINPYENALLCLATQLSPEQKATSISVEYFVDRTGKEAYAPDGASGKFLSQGSEDILMSSLSQTGMAVVESNPSFRSMLDWTVPKLAAGGVPAGVVLPDILVKGSFSTFDFGSSSVNELYVMGIGGGSRGYSIRYTMDIRAVSMAGNSRELGGKVLANLSLEKDVVGREKRAGVAGFFGPSNSSTYLQINLNTQKRELLQYSQRFMISRAAFGIVAKLWNVTSCDEQLQYSDGLVSGQVL